MFEWLPYDVLLWTHIGAFIFNIALVVIADLHAAAWVFGFMHYLPARRMVWLHRLIGIGLVLSIVSGFIMFWPLRDYLLTVDSFYVKIGLVAALVVNAVLIGRHLEVATTKAFRELATAEKVPLFVSGFVSTAGWVGVFIAAQYLGL